MNLAIFAFLSSTEAKKNTFSQVFLLTIMSDNDMSDCKMEDYIPVKDGSMPEG